ncbi:vacuolar fusion protein mon1 homolog a-like [Lichtheimia corymbifera JMRC:FSU:9682]|uniref:Vacuolar fusion protein MON1 n=1 Tax=Lichtheimia corymbifera JMRC:FSU:9682 TaxID=1263082 RepID=A0A068RTB4_9FUNG|nr:vacuolar fusion protein mon1 homolog a-like [Lichtheimia corymbifera JMRC:FSU:9682]
MPHSIGIQPSPSSTIPSDQTSMAATMSSSYDSNTSTNSKMSDPVKSYNKLRRQGSRSSVAAGKRKLDETNTSNWIHHKKHFFILSSAGKPIWTRYGDESRISSLMGVIQAIISFFQDGDDAIKSMNAGQHKFVFLLRDPLYYVAVSKTGESEVQLRDQLLYLHNQILSVLTGAQLTRIFEQRVNFDLRRLLAGTEVFLDSLSTLFNKDHSFMLSALQCLRLSRRVRDQTGAILSGRKIKGLLYAMVVAKGRLVTLLRPRRHSLHPSDLHLLFNMLTGSTTFHTAESWTPLCLPKFNSKGFLHAYICYIAKDISIVMISTDKDRFFDLSEWKSSIVESMQKENTLQSIINASEHSYKIESIGAPGLAHFLYKSKIHVQFTCPEYSDPYTNDVHQKRLFRLYHYVYDRMHCRARPLKLYYHESDQEIILGWITSSFELYVVFKPGTSKQTIISSSNYLLRWIRRNEESLFIVDSPVF